MSNSENSVLIPINPNTTYEVTSNITCKRCGWKCGYFGIVLDSMDRETLRKKYTPIALLRHSNQSWRIVEI